MSQKHESSREKFTKSKCLNIQIFLILIFSVDCEKLKGRKKLQLTYFICKNRVRSSLALIHPRTIFFIAIYLVRSVEITALPLSISAWGLIVFLPRNP